MVDALLLKLIFIITIIIMTPTHHILMTVGKRVGGAAPWVSLASPRVMVVLLTPGHPCDGPVVGTVHQQRVRPVVGSLSTGCGDTRQLTEGREGRGVPQVLRQGPRVVVVPLRLQGGVVELVEQLGGRATGAVLEESEPAPEHRGSRRRGDGVVAGPREGGVEVGSGGGRDERVVVGQRHCYAAGDFLGSLLQKTLPAMTKQQQQQSSQKVLSGSVLSC